MIEMRFGAAALAHVRFAISPLLEATRSIRVLGDPGGQALHLRWIAEARRQTADLDLSLVRALQPRDRYSPDFASPPPRSPLAEFEDELAAMTATPLAQIRSGDAGRVRSAAAACGPGAVRARPACGSHRAGGAAARVLGPGPGGTLAADPGAVGGRRPPSRAPDGRRRRAAAVRRHRPDGALVRRRAADREACRGSLDLEERGLLLVPSVFTWPLVLLITDPRWQPTIVYPARGVGTLWEPGGPAAPEALARLLGRVRASVLMALDRPRSTTDLARALGVSTGGVSQHLAVLRDAGLVHGHRVGRVVLYMRSPAGEGLVEPARWPAS